MAQASETDFRGLAGVRAFELELRGFFESKHSGYYVVGELLPENIVVHHAIVIGLACKRHPILGAGQFLHQLLDRLVGFQIRIVLSNRIKIGEGFGQQVLGSAQPLDTSAVARITGSVLLGADRVIAGFHYLGKGRFFMGHVGFGRVDQVGYQVVPALQLDINLSKTILELIAQGNQLVIDKYQIENDNGNNNKANDSTCHGSSSQVSGGSGVIFHNLAVKCLYKAFEILETHGFAVVVALDKVTTAPGQVGCLLCGFHAFSDDRQVQAVAQIDDDVGDTGIILIQQQVTYKLFVDLEALDRHFFQVGER